MKNKIFTKCIIVVFLVILGTIAVCEYLQSGISSGIVRLHIIANSNSEVDQNIKMEVRDAIIDAQKEIFDDGIKKKLSKREEKKLIAVANDVLRSNGVEYSANIETGNFYFPTKEYANITLPAGNYDAVRVILGDAHGENWWCVMYPPLCFNDCAIGKAEEESLDKLKESMTEFEYKIISEETIKTVPAFKLVEIWQGLKEKIRNSV